MKHIFLAFSFATLFSACGTSEKSTTGATQSDPNQTTHHGPVELTGTSLIQVDCQAAIPAAVTFANGTWPAGQTTASYTMMANPPPYQRDIFTRLTHGADSYRGHEAYAYDDQSSDAIVGYGAACDPSPSTRCWLMSYDSYDDTFSVAIPGSPGGAHWDFDGATACKISTYGNNQDPPVVTGNGAIQDDVGQ